MDNIIIIQLESISESIFSQFKNSMPFLYDIRKKSINFSNFIVSATSTHMSQASFFYGTDTELDHISDFYSITDKIKNPKNHLFYKLDELGYKTFGIGLTKPSEHENNIFHSRKIWIEEISGKFNYYSSLKYCLNGFDKISQNTTPFAVIVHPLISHLAYSDTKKNMTVSAFDRLSYGFKIVDDLCRGIFNLAEKNGIIENTKFIFWGDHGDDFLTKSFNNGMCHSIEPFNNIIHTPLFIYNKKISSKENDKLVGLCDCKNIILEKKFNINNVVFSQNLFFNQKPSLILNKSFAAVNTKYMLIVSGLGLEMYDRRLDPECNNNLLSFYKLLDSSIVFKTRFNITHRHFKMLLNKDNIDEIKFYFSFLRMNLIKHLKVKKQLVGNKMKYKFSLANFSKIRKRQYYWRYPIN